jgi:hypothetical protein
MPGLVPGIHVFADLGRKTWMAGHRRAEATPSFGRLCPAMTNHRFGFSPVTNGLESVKKTYQVAGVGAGPFMPCPSFQQRPGDIKPTWFK